MRLAPALALALALGGARASAAPDRKDGEPAQGRWSTLTRLTNMSAAESRARTAALPTASQTSAQQWSGAAGGEPGTADVAKPQILRNGASGGPVDQGSDATLLEQTTDAPLDSKGPQDATPWKKWVDRASKALLAAVVVLTAAGIMAAWGRRLLANFATAGTGAALLTAARVLSLGALAAAAFSATVGVLLLTKWGQRLQGGVMTAASAIMIVAAAKAAAGDAKAGAEGRAALDAASKAGGDAQAAYIAPKLAGVAGGLAGVLGASLFAGAVLYGSRYIPQTPATAGSAAAAGRLPPVLPGWDAAKWNDPSYHDPQYDVGRILARYSPTPAGLKQALPEIQKAYPGATITGANGDQLRFADGSVVGVIAPSPSGATSWTWRPASGASSAAAPSGPGSGSSAGSSPGSEPGASSPAPAPASAPGHAPAPAPADPNVPTSAPPQTSGNPCNSRSDGLFPDVAFFAGSVWCAVQTAQGAQTYLTIARLGSDLSVASLKQIPIGGGLAFPRLGSAGGALWVAYRDGSTGMLVKLPDGPPQPLGLVGGNDPFAMGAGMLAYQAADARFTIHRRTLGGTGADVVVGPGRPTGLSQVLSGGKVTLVDDERVQPGLGTRPCFAGSFVVVEGSTGGNLARFPDGSKLLLWPGKITYTPRCAQTATGYAVATWGEHDTHLAVVSPGPGKRSDAGAPATRSSGEKTGQVVNAVPSGGPKSAPSPKR